MEKQSKSNKLKIYGAVYIWITILMFGFLFLTPLIPNSVGLHQDEEILDNIDLNIQKYRTSEIKITFVNSANEPLSGYSVNYNQTRHEFLFGGLFSNYNVTNHPQNTTEFNELFLKLFNYATLPFYWTLWESDQGKYPAEERINQTIQFCQEHNITMKGHPVFWSFPTLEPGWTFEGNVSHMQAILRERVSSTIGKYKGIIDIWDYFNEFAHWADDYHGVSKPEFMKNAVTWAKEDNPNSILLAADFSILGHGGTSGQIYWFYRDLVKKGVNFDVMSIQAHQFGSDWYSPAKMYESLDAFAQLGKPIHLAEYFLTSQPVPYSNANSRGILNEEMQAQAMIEFYRVAFSHPAVQSISIWGLSDDPNKKDKLGILDENNHPKLSYFALDDLLNHEWHSEGHLITNESGTITFKGFFGTYGINIPSLSKEFTFSSTSSGFNEFTIVV